MFDQALENGTVSGSAEYVDEYFAPHYRWMMDQMAQRIPGYDGQVPVWAWHSPKPDLRWTVYRSWSRPALLVEWCAPAGSVLLSDLDLWHAVLNRFYLSPGRKGQDAWERRVHRETGRTSTTYEDLPPHLQAEMRESWQQIFEYESLALDPDWWGAERWIQAVVPEMRLDQVILVRELSDRSYLPETDDEGG
jgi:hypothetical protein